MTEITLYTHEKQGAGLTITNVSRVKNASALRVITEETKQDLPLNWNKTVYLPTRQKNTPAAGKADLLLRVAEQEINLCICKDGVAVVVFGTDVNATIYWLRAGQCYKIERDVVLAATLGKNEADCCPEQQLPPQID